MQATQTWPSKPATLYCSKPSAWSPASGVEASLLRRQASGRIRLHQLSCRQEAAKCSQTPRLLMSVMYLFTGYPQATRDPQATVRPNT